MHKKIIRKTLKKSQAGRKILCAHSFMGDTRSTPNSSIIGWIEFAPYPIIKKIVFEVASIM